MTALAVQIEGLSKSFDGRLVLDGVDLKVPCGSIVSIIGSSGGGKTTLMRCVNLLERPDRARMEVAGGSPSSTAGGWSAATSRACARRSGWSSSASTCSRT